jgi:hypothetical protein
MEAALVEAIGSTLTNNPKLQAPITTEPGFWDHIYTLNTPSALTKSARICTNAIPLHKNIRTGDAICAQPSKLMPSASNEDDIVFAVYSRPQAPTVGIASFPPFHKPQLND